MSLPPRVDGGRQPWRRVDIDSCSTRGSSATTRANVSADSTARTANDPRHPAAVPNDVNNGTPRTRPAEAPLPASARARPTCAPETSRGEYPITSEKNSACVTPPKIRPTATTENNGATATRTLLNA